MSPSAQPGNSNNTGGMFSAAASTSSSITFRTLPRWPLSSLATIVGDISWPSAAVSSDTGTILSIGCRSVRILQVRLFLQIIQNVRKWPRAESFVCVCS